MLLRPTVEEERWLALGARLPEVREDSRYPVRSGVWKALGLMKRSALFALGVACSGLTFAVLELMHLPGQQWLCAAVLLSAAEWLIVGRRLFGCGIEEALEATGLLIIAVVSIDFRLDGHDAGLWLLMAAAMGFAGMRLLNPLFTTISVMALSGALHDVLSPPGHADAAWAAWLSGAACFAVAAAALASCTIEFRRPSHDRMIEWLVVAMPACGYLWLALGRSDPSPWLTACLLLAFGAAALAVGVVKRLHAPLAAFMVCAGCVAYEFRRISGLALEDRLMLGGGGVLLIAIALERCLRKPRGGVTSRQLDADASLDLLQFAGYAALGPPAEPAGPDRLSGGGGTSSGGGASGTF